MQSKEKWFISCPSSSHLLIIVSTRPVARHCHCSLFLLWKSKTRRVKDTSMLITVCLSAMETHVLECLLCTLRRPFSMASCCLKAYGLKWQWGTGDARAIISPSCTPAGNMATIKEGREGGNDRRSPTVALLHSAHTSLFSGRCKKLKSCQCFCSQAPLFHCVLRSQLQIIESL